MTYSAPWFSAICTQFNGTAYLIPRQEPFFLNPSQATNDTIYHLTGFTGSRATILVTWEKIFLYVDSRYTLQGEKQCPECTIITCSDPIHALHQQLVKGTRLILSPWVFSAHTMKILKERAFINEWDLVLDHDGIADRLICPQPLMSRNEIVPMEGQASFQEKCQKIFTEPHHNHWIVCKASDVAWLSNLRGSDHVYAPFFHAYLIVTRKNNHFSGILYATMPRSFGVLDPDLRIENFENLQRLRAGSFESPGKGSRDMLLQGQEESMASEPPCIRPPCFYEVKNLLDQPMVYDPHQTPGALVGPSWIPGSFSHLENGRSIKTQWETHHMTQSHVSDGVAVTQFLHWLSQLSDTPSEVPASLVPPGAWNETEWSAAEQLARFRSQGGAYRGPSFPTISAMGANSAMTHYTPSPTDSAPLEGGLYLVDSGGQYHFGTTDVTRTVWLGKGQPPLKFKEMYTQVLQGHIHLSQMIFPMGTNGMQLDAIARSFLWQKGLDYAHSTGHGVGCFASVHEFPPSLAQRGSLEPIAENMVFSVEPGYYEENWGGIRLENLVLVAHHSEKLLRLQPLTMAPFDRNLILVDRLSYEHRIWLNDYHEQVQNTLLPGLSALAQAWLTEQTQPL